jgi:hypothetical protein
MDTVALRHQCGGHGRGVACARRRPRLARRSAVRRWQARPAGATAPRVNGTSRALRWPAGCSSSGNMAVAGSQGHPRGGVSSAGQCDPRGGAALPPGGRSDGAHGPTRQHGADPPFKVSRRATPRRPAARRGPDPAGARCQSHPPSQPCFVMQARAGALLLPASGTRLTALCFHRPIVNSEMISRRQHVAVLMNVQQQSASSSSAAESAECGPSHWHLQYPECPECPEYYAQHPEYPEYRTVPRRPRVPSACCAAVRRATSGLHIAIARRSAAKVCARSLQRRSVCARTSCSISSSDTLQSTAWAPGTHDRHTTT